MQNTWAIITTPKCASGTTPSQCAVCRRRQFFAVSALHVPACHRPPAVFHIFGCPFICSRGLCKRIAACRARRYLGQLSVYWEFNAVLVTGTRPCWAGNVRISFEFPYVVSFGYCPHCIPLMIRQMMNQMMIAVIQTIEQPPVRVVLCGRPAVQLSRLFPFPFE